MAHAVLDVAQRRQFSVHTSPIERYRRSYEYEVESENETICSGRFVNPSVRDGMLRNKRPHMEWKFREEIISHEIGYCRSTIRDASGRRLAVWERHNQAVIRNHLPGKLEPVLVGMILAKILDTTIND